MGNLLRVLEMAGREKKALSVDLSSTEYVNMSPCWMTKFILLWVPIVMLPPSIWRLGRVKHINPAPSRRQEEI